jgi:hypothetical protein
MIFLQISGGLGNQLFIWSGAHFLHNSFHTRIKLILVEDQNSRLDRPLEVKNLEDLCNHGITITQSRAFEILIKTVDKFKLEKHEISKNLLQFLGLYSFNNPTEFPKFSKGKPRFIRCYFQNAQIVEKSWSSWEGELRQAIQEIDTVNYDNLKNSVVVHVRRGDTLVHGNSQGVLTCKYFAKAVGDNHQAVLCTDDTNLPIEFLQLLNPRRILTPNEVNVWQTLKIFLLAQEFHGSNSTLSWWAAFCRASYSNGLSTLPTPWRKISLGDENSLRIKGTLYRDSEFVNAD